jgi:Heparinase II/III-like protein
MALGRSEATVIIVLPMGSLPLLTAAELNAASHRWERRQRGEAAWLLYKDVESILSDPVYESLPRLSVAYNPLQIRGILMAASLAFRLSGDTRYLEPLRRCVTETAEEKLRRAQLPDELHSAFVIVGLTVAHELCGPTLDQDTIVSTVAAMTGELHDDAEREPWGERVPKRHAWNHSAVAFAAIGCGGLLCRGADPRAEHWIETAVERLLLFFEHGITASGMGREGLSYCGFVFRNAAPFLLAARNAGIWDFSSPLDNHYVERLRLVPRWYAIETFPGGSFLQPINDSHWSPRTAMGGFLPIFGALDPPLAGWVYERLLGAEGDGSHGRHRGFGASTLFESVLWPPAQSLAPGQSLSPPSSSKPSAPEVLADPVVGYLAERVYDQPAGSFSFNCGEFLGGIHDQSDNGSITLFSGEVPLLIDSGTGNDPVEGSASSSHGHNVVLIDGCGQVPSGGGAGCAGRIVQAERHAQATVVTADLTAAYAARGYNPVRYAIRHCIFGKRPFSYLLIVDDFSRPHAEPAVFEQLFHTPAVAESRYYGGELRARIEFAGTSRWLEIRALDDDAEMHEGVFVQHDPRLFHEHPVWRLRRVGRRATMAALLLAYEDHRPEVRTDFDPRGGRVTLAWRVAGEQGVDVLEITPGLAAAAVLTRDGLPLSDAEQLFAQPGSRPRSAQEARL